MVESPTLFIKGHNVSYYPTAIATIIKTTRTTPLHPVDRLSTIYTFYTVLPAPEPESLLSLPTWTFPAHPNKLELRDPATTWRSDTVQHVT